MGLVVVVLIALVLGGAALVLGVGWLITRPPKALRGRQRTR